MWIICVEKNLLLFLETYSAKLPAPKDHFVLDVWIQSDIPNFATSISPITYLGRNYATGPDENDMMDQ